MPQESTALPLGGFTLDRTLPEPLYQQLYERLKDSICSGQLRPGVRLPATRTLAQELRVSRNTVLVAYERLVTERLPPGRWGRGPMWPSTTARDDVAARERRRSPDCRLRPRSGAERRSSPAPRS
nr:GntR family transcriptional regulator [Streptomyces sp. LBUM 1477]